VETTISAPPIVWGALPIAKDGRPV